LSPGQALGIAAAGAAAGAVNTVVGSGSLITFPTLLAFGYAPVTANVSNNVGLVFGSVSGAIGYRRELKGQRERIRRLGVGSVLGGVLGAVLLIVLPAKTFEVIVPVFVALAVVGVLVQPRLSDWIGHRRGEPSVHGGAPAVLAAGVAGVYGGYFGAAQGIMLLAVLGLLLDETLQRLNGLKNVLTGLVNGCAAVVFIVAAHVDWGAAALIAGGSLLGGQIGARYGRRLPPAALRGLVAVVGVAAIVQLLT
jgi:uncharacterized membrane protein YfcA